MPVRPRVTLARSGSGCGEGSPNGRPDSHSSKFSGTMGAGLWCFWIGLDGIRGSDRSDFAGRTGSSCYAASVTVRVTASADGFRTESERARERRKADRRPPLGQGTGQSAAGSDPGDSREQACEPQRTCERPGGTVGNVSYHVQILEKYGLVRLIGRTPGRRGRSPLRGAGSTSSLRQGVGPGSLSNTRGT
jgi:hypothetical protein